MLVLNVYLLGYTEIFISVLTQRIKSEQLVVCLLIKISPPRHSVEFCMNAPYGGSERGTVQRAEMPRHICVNSTA